jgi:hypothetical protein
MKKQQMICPVCGSTDIRGWEWKFPNDSWAYERSHCAHCEFSAENIAFRPGSLPWNLNHEQALLEKS